MICIDSSCVIDFLRGDKNARDVIFKYKEDIVTTEITIFEVFLGVYLSNKKNEENILESFFDSLDVLNIGGWGDRAAKIFANLSEKGSIIEQNDCLIVATMLVNGCNKILTKNVKHFSRIEGIEVISY
jgi:tRNA(fMet)-specific endonuclease VapC